MPETVVDSPAPSCSLLLSESGIPDFQSFSPDPSWPRARDARGRFAKGSSGNPRGRPRGIRNPKRRVPDLAARPLSARALADLLDRKPHLLRALADQLLPPPRVAIDPAKRLGIDVSSLRTAEDCRWIMPTVLAAIARGEITPAEVPTSRGGCAPSCAGSASWLEQLQSTGTGKTASGPLRERLCWRPESPRGKRC
jgi:hypothetical protein